LETVEEDYSKPLREVYKSLPEKTRVVLSADVRKIWGYFISWLLFIAFSAIAVAWFIAYGYTSEPLGGRLQRIGSIVPVLAVVGEALFITRLHKLASVIHPAQLTIEIYKQRRFRPLVYVSLWLTFIIVFAGAVLSGYGDLLF
tara:strand:- start:1060 stop:1488 length:429 start_codon:yes stop_codon:yes gene_type:complete